MKKLSQEQKNRQCRIIIKRLNRRAKRKSKESKSGYFLLEAPTVFSLSKNYHETTKFFSKMKRISLLSAKRGHRKIWLEIATISHISLGAALMLAAEIDRWQRVRGVRLGLKNYGDWSPPVKALLSDIGFFELLGTELSSNYRKLLPNDAISVLEIVTCDSTDGAKITQITKQMEAVAQAFSHDPLIYGAMLEATYNGFLHGYPKDFDYTYPPLRGQWWATASWSPRENTVRFIVYDQGVGIAHTLPTWTRYEKLIGWISQRSSVASTIFKEHALMIEGALEVSRTSRTVGHGQGFSDMMAPVDAMLNSSLRILSGKGEVLYKNGEGIKKVEHDLHLGGTLVEWTFPVGAE